MINNKKEIEYIIKRNLSISLEMFSIKFVVLYFFIFFIILGGIFGVLDWFVFSSIITDDSDAIPSTRVIGRFRSFGSLINAMIFAIIFQLFTTTICSWHTAIIVRNVHFKNKCKRICNFIKSNNQLVSQYNLLNKLKFLNINNINIKVPIFIPKITVKNYECNYYINDQRSYLTKFNFEWKSLKFTIIFDSILYIDKTIKIGYKINDLNKEKLLIINNINECKSSIIKNIDDKWITLNKLKPFVTKRIKNFLYSKRYGFDAIGDDFYSSSKLLNDFLENDLKNLFEIPGIWFYQKEYMPEFNNFLENKILYELELINEIMNFNYGNKPTYVEKATNYEEE